MSRNNDTDMSELEREFELEMEGDESESKPEEELESDWEAESVSDEEADEESDEEFESEPTEAGGYADRFYELSQREFESESELDDEVRGIVNEMERDFFWGKWKKRLKSIGGRLLKKGLGQLAGRLPVFKGLQALTQAARAAMKGDLGGLAKSAFTTVLSAHPAGAVALPALKALGFEATGDSERNREAWDNYVEVAREAFDHLGRNLDERTADPLEASRLASNAFQTAVRKVQARVRSNGTQVRDHRKRSMTIQVRRGERIIIEGI
jgi:hypothetical protein